MSLARHRFGILGAALLLVSSLVSIATINTAHAAVGPLPSIENFEGNVPITTASPGIFPFGNDAASTPKLSVVAAADRPGAASDNHGLDVPYTVSGYGGFSDNLSTPQNWSGYGGFSFWAKGTGSGAKIEFEVKDGGTDGEHAELWQGFFTDAQAGWQQVQLPFAKFVKRTDYQPQGAPSDGKLNLTSMWGYAINLPVGSGHLVFDDVAVYGKAQPQVSAAPGAQLVNPGQSATVKVTASTPDGSALGSAASVSYVLGGGTAVAGKDFTAKSGTLTFAAGSPSGTTKTITVATIAGTPAATAKSIPVTFTATGADFIGDQPQVVINAHGLPYLNPKLPTAQRVSDLLARMSLADKVGQMTQAERAAVGTGADISTYRLGSLRATHYLW